MGSIAAAAGLNATYETPMFRLILIRANEAADLSNGVADNMVLRYLKARTFSIDKSLVIQTTKFVNTKMDVLIQRELFVI